MKQKYGSEPIQFTLFSSNLQILSTDFEIGHFLRARIIPKAVLYYTGDVVDEDDEDDFDEEEEEEGKYTALNTRTFSLQFVLFCFAEF